MNFLIKNLEEIEKITQYQCVNEFGCHCENCCYYNTATKRCESVEEFSISFHKIKNFLEKHKVSIEKHLTK